MSWLTDMLKNTLKVGSMALPFIPGIGTTAKIGMMAGSQGLNSILGRNSNPLQQNAYSGIMQDNGDYNADTGDVLQQVMGGYNSSTGTSSSGTLSKIFDFIKKNPNLVLGGASILGSIPGGLQNQKLTDAQIALLKERLRQTQMNQGLRTDANQALRQMIARGPFYGM